MSNIEVVHIGLATITLIVVFAQALTIIDLRVEVAELHENRAQLQKQLEQLQAQIINKE